MLAAGQPRGAFRARRHTPHLRVIQLHSYLAADCMPEWNMRKPFEVCLTTPHVLLRCRALRERWWAYFIHDNIEQINPRTWPVYPQLLSRVSTKQRLLLSNKSFMMNLDEAPLRGKRLPPGGASV